MSFWSCVLKPGGKPAAFVPPPSGFVLHLSQAALPATAAEGSRVSVVLKRSSDDEEGVIVATLCGGRLDSVSLDLFLDHYAEFSLLAAPGKGGAKAEVHLSGYYSPPDEAGAGLLDDDEDEDEDEEYIADEDDDDDETDPHMNHALAMLANGGSDEDDEDEDDEEEEDLSEPGVTRKGGVVIEEINDAPEAGSIKPGRKTGQAQVHATAPAAMDDDGGEGEYNDDDDEGADAGHEAEEEDEGEAEEEGEEEIEEQEAEDKAPKNAPITKQPVQLAVKQLHGSAHAVADAGKGKLAAVAKENKRPAEAPVQQPLTKKQARSAKAEAAATAAAAAAAAPAKAPASTSTPATEVRTGKKNIRTWENGFSIEDLAMGPPNGKLAKQGKRVDVKYVGRLVSSGKVFDQTTGNKPFTFRLGVGEVIKGWDLGVAGMRVGDKRRLVVPPQLGYGSSGVKGAIPPNATLQFDVELVNVK